ncbi:hydrolase [Myceligenerans pegani]|uniref:Hydrolase n=1 Tax=Myceligenerans pegani TaxID=2776917 RepID=A0ABR9MZS1_9MICO|nr:hydrolase [Myceligenerans sp. TRM 65318]MBE1876262.1 hydrolase [Myceligenerans sp. TRM 65318]MBE3018533.1 hydrolase [Myceligenerans sp. TRM 65318]
MARSLLPAVIDHHVHLGLVDPDRLAGSVVAEVHDLGWDPVVIAAIAKAPPSGVKVRFAGPFHTAPGGYPTGRAWVPRAAVRPVAGRTDAQRAVADVVAVGGSFVKIALHADMPLLDDVTLVALVRAARAAGLPAVVHAEGAGQAARALGAGAEVLVHAPFSEPLPDKLLRASAGRTTWISTLSIHEGEALATALDNVRRFSSAGGAVVYGTDMGNGNTPVGLNTREIELLGEAGLTGKALLRAVVGAPDRVVPGRALISPHPRPETADELVDWLTDARRLTPADLEALT